MQCPQWDLIPGPCKPPLNQEIYTDEFSRGDYEPTTVPIILGRGTFPLLTEDNRVSGENHRPVASH